MILIKQISDQGSPEAPMPSFSKPRFLVVFLTLTALVFSPLGCSYKPSYLDKSDSTKISERWKVVRLDPAKMSADEKAVFETMGLPAYIRFFRHLSVAREMVYEWIYDEPVQLFTFMNGKKVDYLVLDENPSSLNEAEKNFLFWTGIVVGSLAVIGGAAYYFTSGNDD
jgi:hypothetical protein